MLSMIEEEKKLDDELNPNVRIQLKSQLSKNKHKGNSFKREKCIHFFVL